MDSTRAAVARTAALGAGSAMSPAAVMTGSPDVGGALGELVVDGLGDEHGCPGLQGLASMCSATRVGATVRTKSMEKKMSRSARFDIASPYLVILRGNSAREELREARSWTVAEREKWTEGATGG